MRIIFMLALPFISCGQSPKSIYNKPMTSFQWPKPIRDSDYAYNTCDTMRGTIHVPVGNGEIKAKGFVTSCRTWQGSTPIYSPKDQKIIDSVGKSSGIWVMGGAMSSGDPNKTAYIITYKGNVRVEGSFTMTPD